MRKKRALQANLQKAKMRLARQLRKLEEAEFHCEADARQAIQVFADERRRWFPIRRRRPDGESACQTQRPWTAQQGRRHSHGKSLRPKQRQLVPDEARWKWRNIC